MASSIASSQIPHLAPDCIFIQFIVFLFETEVRLQKIYTRSYNTAINLAFFNAKWQFYLFRMQEKLVQVYIRFRSEILYQTYHSQILGFDAIW